MTDVFNNEVNIGDKVAYVTVRYSMLKIGVVTKLTPKGVTIDNVLNRARYQIIKEVSNDKN